MFVRVRVQDNSSMVMFEEIDENWFSLYWTNDHVPINSFNHDFLSETEMDVLEILEEFRIMSSREIM